MIFLAHPEVVVRDSRAAYRRHSVESTGYLTSDTSRALASNTITGRLI